MKKKDEAPAYSTYSLVPAAELMDAIARLNAPSTQHYFHYYLIERQWQQL